ncbi:hypothetical protein KUTeg_018738 [Tegillarca granosa]|uniref:Uncharacterized protein n=1 Tax=Tegillarca granosa TaxID=220873 RepID=A0ABQ9EH26_TEGGR|nr:hypothetical protein KUTeg_018738 [Tegillarca granosa]
MVLLLLSAIITFYYNIITTWVLYYIVNSFVNLIPWSTCDNDWNTQFCVSKNTHINTSEGVSNQHMFPIYAINNTSGNDTERNVSLISNTYVTTAEDFWQNSVSSLKSVVYVTATMPYIILAVLFVRGVTLPGGVDSIVWLEAALQNLSSKYFSIRKGWKDIKRSNGFTVDAVSLTFISEGTSIYGGLAIFSILGYMAKNVGKPINEVITSGPGLGFIGYPEAIMLLPIPNLWAVLFFVMLLTVALDSLAGIYNFQLLDWYIGALSLIVFGILECINFGLIYAILLKIRSACRPSHLWRPNDSRLCKQQENDNRDSATPFMK